MPTAARATAVLALVRGVAAPLARARADGPDLKALQKKFAEEGSRR